MKTATRKPMFAVVYVGAPYGANEFGQIVSRHRTREAASVALDKLQNNPRYYGSNATVKAIPAGR